ncbi:MAG: hypothetical protein ACK4ZW_17375 [Blastomonas sp.]
MKHILEMNASAESAIQFSKIFSGAFSPVRTPSFNIPSPQERQVGSSSINSKKEYSGIFTVNDQIESKLFNATANAKIWTSKVAMYLKRETRDRIFRQLDSLHDLNEWIAGDEPLNLESYKSCIRAIIFHKINSKPGFALMPSGNILALWQDDIDKLSIEFLTNNKTRWMIQHSTLRGTERAAGEASVERLREILAPYGADRWFSAS